MTTVNFQSELSELKVALHSFAFKLTKNREDSEDLYQETAYKALVNQDKFKDGTNLKAWLFTIMRNIFINNYRRKSKQQVILDQTASNYFINTGSKAVLNDANSNLLMAELEELVNELKDNVRIPFLMHYYGYRYNEIAAQLDLPLGTVKSRIYFARKQLRKAIKSNYKESIIFD